MQTKKKRRNSWLTHTPDVKSQMEGVELPVIVTDEKKEIERLKSELTKCEFEKEKALMKSKFNEEKAAWKEQATAIELKWKEEQITSHKLRFEVERATWDRRGSVGEPRPKVARREEAKQNVRMRKVNPKNIFIKLESTAVSNHDVRVHKFLDYTEALEAEDNSFPIMSAGEPDITLACEPSETGHYRVLGVRYEGQRVSTFRLLRNSIIKEAYGVARGDEQLLVLVLFDRNSMLMDGLASFIARLIPIRLKSVCVYTEGAPTADPILAGVKKPSDFKWMYTGSRT